MERSSNITSSSGWSHSGPPACKTNPDGSPDCDQSIRYRRDLNDRTSIDVVVKVDPERMQPTGGMIGLTFRFNP